jgi:hypothetical protein
MPARDLPSQHEHEVENHERTGHHLGQITGEVAWLQRELDDFHGHRQNSRRVIGLKFSINYWQQRLTWGWWL